MLRARHRGHRRRHPARVDTRRLIVTRAGGARTENAAAGWMRRIEEVREAGRRQHAMRVSELEHALTEVWAVLDRIARRGSDRTADELRVAHRDLLTKPPPASEFPV